MVVGRGGRDIGFCFKNKHLVIIIFSRFILPINRVSASESELICPERES